MFRTIIISLLASVATAAVDPHDVGPGYIVPPPGFFTVELQGIDSNPGRYVYLPERNPVLGVTPEAIEEMEDVFVVRYDHGGLSGFYVTAEDEGVITSVNHGYVVNLRIELQEAFATIPLYHLNFRCRYRSPEELALFVMLVSTFAPKGA